MRFVRKPELYPIFSLLYSTLFALTHSDFQTYSRGALYIASFGEKVMRFLVVCCLLVQGGLLADDPTPCMKALIVYDTSSPHISKATSADAKRVAGAFAFMAQQTGGSFHPKVLQASKFTKKTFHAWLKTLDASPSGGALFYYAGIGKNSGNQAWPLIKFGKKKISEEEIAKKIAARGIARTIVFFDCYSRPITPYDAINPNTVTNQDIARFGGGFMWKQKNDRLLMGTSGVNVSTTLCSTSIKPLGGLFTTLFLRGFATQFPAMSSNSR